MVYAFYCVRYMDWHGYNYFHCAKIKLNLQNAITMSRHVWKDKLHFQIFRYAMVLFSASNFGKIRYKGN